MNKKRIGEFSITIAIIITIISCSIILDNIRKSKYYHTPLNNQIDQVIIINNKIYYIIFGVVIFSYIIGIIQFTRYILTLKNEASLYEYYMIVFIILISTVILCIIAFIYYNRREVNKRFNALNTKIRSYIYKNNAFLDTLKNSDINTDISIYKTIQTLVESITSNDEHLIKKLVTLTLFYHFANTCRTNGEIDKEDVFKMFNNKDILYNKDQAAKYLKKEYNNIKNILDTLILRNLRNDTIITGSVRKKYNDIINDINQSANNLKLEIPMFKSLISVLLSLNIFNGMFLLLNTELIKRLYVLIKK